MAGDGQLHLICLWLCCNTVAGKKDCMFAVIKADHISCLKQVVTWDTKKGRTHVHTVQILHAVSAIEGLACTCEQHPEDSHNQTDCTYVAKSAAREERSPSCQVSYMTGVAMYWGSPGIHSNYSC